jgi:hypothetical protein
MSLRLDWILAPLVLGTALNAAEPAPEQPQPDQSTSAQPMTDSSQADVNSPPQRSARSSVYDEDGARHIAEAHGFYGVGRMAIDSSGVWHGTAIQFGRITKFKIDPRGNFSAIATSPP